jgi:translation initiation factor IF-2
VTIIVAINKIDKPQANIDQVKKQLSKLDLMSESWGGKTITVLVSAKTGEGIDNLLEMILLEAQMLELKANPDKLAKGVVLEAKVSKGRGPVATLLVQNGTLHLNENIIVGKYYGKIRAMFNSRGQAATSAGPSMPIEILGLAGVPQAGEQFFVIEDERLAKELTAKREEKEKQSGVKTVKRISLEDLYSQIKEGKLKELKLVIKSDMRGSIEAIREVLSKLNLEEIKLNIIHEGVGSINSSDVMLAAASNALIVGFHVACDEPAKELLVQEGVEVRTYNVIYELANDVKAALEGMLDPKLKKVFLGRIEIRKVLKVSHSGTIAGCFVSKGKITRSASVVLVRNGEIIFEGGISSLKRFKDDVREVGEGFECGIALGGFDSYQEGDIIEAHEIEKTARKL